MKYFLAVLTAVPSGSGALQMPTRPSSSAASSTLRRGRANFRNALVTFFCHEASLG